MRNILMAAANSRKDRFIRGEQLITQIGASTWVCPPGVTKVSMAMVSAGTYGGYSGVSVRGGAGGTLRFKNDIDVVPGQSYEIFVGRGDSSSSNARSSAFGIISYPPGGGTSTPVNQNGVSGFHGAGQSSLTTAVGVIPQHGNPGDWTKTGLSSNLIQDEADGIDLDGTYGPDKPYGKGGYYFFMNNTSHGILIGRSTNNYDLRYQKGTQGAVRIVWGEGRSFPNTDVAYE